MEIKTKFTTGERAFFLDKNVGYIYECEIHTVKATMSKDFGTLIRYGIYYYDCETMKDEINEADLFRTVEELLQHLHDEVQYLPSELNPQSPYIRISWENGAGNELSKYFSYLEEVAQWLSNKHGREINIAEELESQIADMECDFVIDGFMYHYKQG